MNIDEQYTAANLMRLYQEKLAKIASESDHLRKRARDIRAKLDELDEQGNIPQHMQSVWNQLKTDGQKAEQKAADMVQQWENDHRRFGKSQGGQQ